MNNINDNHNHNSNNYLWLDQTKQTHIYHFRNQEIQICNNTFSSCSVRDSSQRSMGLPTTQGKTEVGKFSPAKPHFTYCIHRQRKNQNGNNKFELHENEKKLKLVNWGSIAMRVEGVPRFRCRIRRRFCCPCCSALLLLLQLRGFECKFGFRRRCRTNAATAGWWGRSTCWYVQSREQNETTIAFVV